MKRKVLGLMMAVVAAVPAFVNAEEGSVKIGDQLYPTLKEAVESVAVCTEEPCETTTINVLENHDTSGIVFESGKYITIDLGGFTVTFKEQTVGSPGTETIDMQILKNSTIVFQNGKFVSSNTERSKMFIQNYANLTLKNIEIDATNELNLYALSNNSGDVNILGNTSIKANKVAFDVCGYHAGGYPIGPKVTVDTTGTIEGTIEVTRDSGTATRELSLLIKNVNHVGELSIQEGLEDNVTIEDGTYTDETVTEIITPAEDSNVYEVGLSDGSVKYVVASEDELEEGYFGISFGDEALEDVYEEEVVALIKEALAEKYNLASFQELFYGNLLNENIVLDSIKSELDEAVKVTLDIPTTIEKVKDGYTRKYVIIRIHENQNGEYETAILDTKDNGDGTITFETDKFSTYVLAYEDVKAATNPETSDNIMTKFIMGSISLISMIVLSIYTIRK